MERKLYSIFNNVYFQEVDSFNAIIRFLINVRIKFTCKNCDALEGSKLIKKHRF